MNLLLKSNLTPYFLIIILCALIFYLILSFLSLSREYEKKETESENKRVHERLRNWVFVVLGIDLNTINEDGTKNEIIRVVNSLAKKTSFLCVQEDEYNRKKGSYPSESVYDNKKKWAEARELAFNIAPELKDRMPHFSEFEPLKSYNAEHLIQKTK